MIEFINLKSQYQKMQKEILEATDRVFSNASFIGGKDIELLEQNLSNFCGAKYAIACSSGTDALLLSLMALDIKAGDEIITSAFSFYATAEVIALLGATPVFVDINDDDYNINASKIEEKITPKTKAIIPVSLFGQTADLDAINQIAQKYSLIVIEDAAQSFGAMYKNKRSCSLTDLATTSFFPAKPLGCYGDGGAVFTNHESLATKIRSLLNHGQTQRYKHKYIGLNARLDTIQAAILNIKLKYFQNEINTRQDIAQIYTQRLATKTKTPVTKDDRLSVYAQYCVRVSHREKLQEALLKQGVPTAVHYPIALFAQEAFSHLKINKNDYPVTNAVCAEILSLPFSPYLSVEDQNKVITEFSKAIS